jgi:hypothetical protein
VEPPHISGKLTRSSSSPEMEMATLAENLSVLLASALMVLVMLIRGLIFFQRMEGTLADRL